MAMHARGSPALPVSLLYLLGGCRVAIAPCPPAGPMCGSRSPTQSMPPPFDRIATLQVDLVPLMEALFEVRPAALDPSPKRQDRAPLVAGVLTP